MKSRPSVRLHLAPLALAGFFSSAAAPSLWAVANSSSSETPTSSAYTNQPQQLAPTVTTFTDSYISPSFSSFGSNSSFNTTTYLYNPANYFYFPPVPPALGETLPRRFTSFTSFSNRPSHAIPITPQLSPYVGEIFYPPLATHLHNEDLSRKQYQQLVTYRDTRADLVAAIHARLDALKDAEPAVRARELAAFAQEQAPRVDALEQEAENIRLDLVRGGFFRSGVDWSDWDANRSWRLGDDLRYESRIDEFKVIRAAAYFYHNLIPAQRRLLQELAMELNEPLTEPTATMALDAPDAYVYFSPETARVHLPKNLPEPLTAKIAAYQKEKSALKEELRSTLYKLDRSFFTFTRKNTLNPLADEQAPRLAALETLAEEIRRDLAAYPNPQRPGRSAASNEIAARVGAYTRERQQLLHAMQERLVAAQRAFPHARVEFSRTASHSKILLIPDRQQSKAEAALLPAYQAELARFNDEQSVKFAELDKTKSALRADLLKQSGKTAPGADGPSVDLMIRKFAAEFQEREAWELFRDYDTAVFEPGLSPGQRRILFNAALQKLDLPIPPGSRQP